MSFNLPIFPPYPSAIEVGQKEGREDGKVEGHLLGINVVGAVVGKWDGSAVDGEKVGRKVGELEGKVVGLSVVG